MTTINLSGNRALEYLNLSFNQLTPFDLTHNTALKTLNLSNNLLTSFELSESVALDYLNFSYNDLILIDLTHNTALKNLDLSYNSLKSIDLSNNVALEYLNLSFNNLTSVNLTRNTALKTLNLAYNILDSIVLLKNTALNSLNLSGNNLTSVDLSRNTALKSLYIHDNSLISIDLSENTQLVNLDCSRQVRSLAVEETEGECEFDFLAFVLDFDKVSDIVVNGGRLDSDGKIYVDDMFATVTYNYSTGNKTKSMPVKLYLDRAFLLKVENGFIEGEEGKAVYVPANNYVVVVAQSAPSGEVFKGWSVDGGRTIIAYHKRFEFIMDKSMTLTAVYVDAQIGNLSDYENNAVNNEPTGLSNDTIALIVVACVVIVFIIALVVYAHYAKKRR